MHSRDLASSSRRAVVLSVAWALGGCAALQPRPSPDNRVAPHFVLPAPGLLVMLQVQPASDPRLRPGDPLLARQMHVQLAAAGYRVVDIDGVYPVAALDAARTAGAALLLQAQLAVRRAEVDASNLEWDGQRRGIRMEMVKTRRVSYSGFAAGVSVELTGWLPDGSEVFHTFGGASFPYVHDVEANEVRLRGDLFDSDAEIADGVRLALAALRR